ncbi:Mpo1-like protein [Pedobacter sp. N23S346]|uniref:Mpo1-like protein n=1 Tax=Pedobacter sp. N23S346 TaxID=3402750 RepID=UPI003AD29BE8
MSEKKFKSLKEFYPFYLSKHTNTTSRILHFVGTGLVALTFFTGFLFHQSLFFIALPLFGCGFPWIGHFFFEKNKPTFFQYPIYTLASDFLIFYDLLNGKQSFVVKK